MPRSLSALSARFHEMPLIQLPGRPNRLQRFQIGGPEDPADRRLQLDRETLKRLLAIAEQSEAGVCTIDQIGLDVSVWEENGHRYEQVTLIGLEPKPKRVPLSISIDRTG